MAMNGSKLLSGRAPVTPYSNLSSDRYQFLGLSEAEPSLGAGPDNSVLTLSTGNTRVWSSNLNLSSLTVSGESNLGDISNVHIFGGTNRQVIQTDGLGNLTFVDASSANSSAPMPYYIPEGQSFYVPPNFQGLFTIPIQIDGTFEVDGILVEVGTAINSTSRQVLFDSEGQITGNIGFTFDQSSGDLSLPGNVTLTGDLIPAANITYNLGTSANRWKDLYLSGNSIIIGSGSISTANGNLTLTNAQGGQITVAGNSSTTSNQIVNQDSNLYVNPNSITVSVNNVSNVGLFSTTGLAIIGTVSATGNAIVDGILTDNYYYANGQPIDVNTASGSNTWVQYSNGTDLAASANFTFDSAANLLSVIGNISITQNLQLTSNSAISINNSIGNAGEVLTSNGTNTYWAKNFYYGPIPPDFATLNYGDIYFLIDTPNNTQRLYMWVTDGTSSYFYDFLPPSF
jgi:hypothetical protein